MPEGRHGYLLLQAIAEAHGFLPDPTGVYRALRGLEEEAMVESGLIEGDGGPARRVYRITEAGRACLATWAVTLREYADTVRKVADLCGSASSL
jgi:DNA-binding PadR family transcriptional regulator